MASCFANPAVQLHQSASDRCAMPRCRKFSGSLATSCLRMERAMSTALCSRRARHCMVRPQSGRVIASHVHLSGSPSGCLRQDGEPRSWSPSSCHCSPRHMCGCGGPTSRHSRCCPRPALTGGPCCTPRTGTCATISHGGRWTHTSTTRWAYISEYPGVKDDIWQMQWLRTG